MYDEQLARHRDAAVHRDGEPVRVHVGAVHGLRSTRLVTVLGAHFAEQVGDGAVPVHDAAAAVRAEQFAYGPGAGLLVAEDHHAERPLRPADRGNRLEPREHAERAVIVEALRTPIARGKIGKGELSGFHAAQLLGRLQTALVERAGIAPKDVEQIFGGCVTQAGEQSNNITRHAWLGANKSDYSTAGTTIDVQCGSGQQAANFAAMGVMAGQYDCVIAGGV